MYLNISGTDINSPGMGLIATYDVFELLGIK